MTGEEYMTWVEHHKALFWMQSEADLDLFRAWAPLVMPYNLQDFIAGSNYLAAERASAFRTEHLTIIRQRITQARLENVRARIAAENHQAQGGDCQTCGGTSIVTVPHRDFVIDGEWIAPFPTMGIFCGHCDLGRHRFETLYADPKRKEKRQPTPMQWQKYEALVPHWKDLLAERAEVARAEQHAHDVGRYADRKAPLKALKAIGRLPSDPPKTQRPPENWTHSQTERTT